MDDSAKPDEPTPSNADASTRRRAVGSGAGRVLLREAPSVNEPLLRPAGRALPDAAAGRYRVLGEVARGGVGVILKGQDVDLGRDVAMKVLREEFADRADILERFVEEAQIGGQLQHPGVVPVYEMGLDGVRPFFTMKFVKGRTLTAWLDERDNTPPDRSVFDVFEKICQTVAYAHARGVVHRDLKPANVMIGAFGEVYVVDWGLAKVLGRAEPTSAAAPGTTVVSTVRTGSNSSQSEVGSVLGTPAYMPPEQARGQIDSLDERADVFALGAILCEILTGRPPYEGEGIQVLVKAGRADQDDARKRLAECGGDPALVALCTDCLAPARDARPENAGRVAERLVRHFASVEERVRGAEVAAAEDRVRATEDARARKLTRVLGAAIAGAVVVAAGTWIVLEGKETARRDAADRRAHEAIDETARLRGLAAGGADAAAWRRALEAARAAVAAAAGATDETKARAANLAADVEAEESAALGAARAKVRDDAMVARLEDSLTRVTDDLDFDAHTRRMLDAFRDYGVDVDGADPAESARRLRASAIATELVDAVEIWSWQRDRKQRQDERLAAIAAAADPSPWRGRIKAAQEDVAALRVLADEAEAAAPSGRITRTIARALAAAGDSDRGASLLESSLLRRPDDYDTASACSYLQRNRVPARFDEAVRWLTAAIALRPASAVTWNSLANVRLQGGDLTGAREAWREAARLNPTLAVARSNIAYSMLLQGDLQGAEREARQATEIDAGESGGHSMLALVFLRKGDYEQALSLAKKGVETSPHNSIASGVVGLVHFSRDEMTEAIACGHEALRLDPGFAKARNMLPIIQYLAGDIAGAVASGRDAVRRDPDSHEARDHLARALLGAGDVEGALAESAEAVRRRPQEVQSHLARGYALSAAGRAAAALAELQSAAVLEPWNAEPAALVGTWLVRTGKVAEAIPSFETAARGQTTTRRQSAVYRAELRRAERAASRLPQFERFLRGEAEPKSADDRIAFAHLAASRGLFVLAASLMEDCIAAGDSDDELRFCGWSPGVIAALAGTGAGTDAASLDDDARTAWRKAALEWLQADLERWRRAFKQGDAAVVPELRWRILREWRWFPDLLPFRTDGGLAALPESERDEWRAFWADVDGLLKRARGE